MLKKLRRKIVYINLLLVSIVLIFAFIIMCVNAYTSAKNELMQSLRAVSAFAQEPHKQQKAENDTSDNRIPPTPPSEEFVPSDDLPMIGGHRNEADRENGRVNFTVAYVNISLDGDGRLLSVTENGVSVSEDLLKKAVDEINASERDSDIIYSLGIAYHVRNAPEGGKTAVLADTGIIDTTLKSSILTSLILYAVCMAIMVGISLFLSHLAVKPTEKAWKQQRRFISDASHELKTPLTVILANNDILLSHGPERVDDQRRWLESTKEEAEHMRGLVERMLMLAKSDEESLTPILTVFDLGELAQGCALYFEPIAYEKDITVSCDIQSTEINSDKAMVTQLLQILLDNAVKHGENSGFVKVAVTPSGNGALLTVTNSGEPIPQEDVKHLFDRFYRADEARGKGGYGLGLSIAKNIADVLKLDLSVKSDLENGTVFSVRFR